VRYAISGGALLAAFLLGALIQGTRQERAVQTRLDFLADKVSEPARLVRQAPAPAAVSPCACASSRPSTGRS